MFKSGRAPISSLAERDGLAWKNAGAWGHEKVLTCPLHTYALVSYLRTARLLRCYVVSSFLQLLLVVALLRTTTNHSEGTGVSK